MKKKIIILIIILIIIIGIAYMLVIKNKQKINEINVNQENQIENINEDFELNVTGKLDLKKLKSYELPIIIDYGAEWCSTCQKMEPDIIKLNKELQGKAIIKMVDIDENIHASDGYKINLLPTQILINSDGTPYIPKDNSIEGFETVKDEDGEILYTKHVGILTRTQIINLLDEMNKTKE